MKTKLLGGLLAVGVVIGLSAIPASAGGWALSSLDAMPEPVAGQDLDVGFTIRQHGVTRVNPTGEVAVRVRSASGATRDFPAQPVGPAGHYVARVQIDEPGSYRWQIRQGWFAPQDLGRIEVREPATPVAAPGAPADSGPGSEYRWPLAMRVLAPLVGLGLGVFAIADAVAARRRRARVYAAT